MSSLFDLAAGDLPPQWDISGVRFTSAPQGRQMLNVTRVAAAAGVCWLRLGSDVQPEQRAGWLLTWRCLKRTRPAIAELLHDPQLQYLQGYFDGEILVCLDEAAGNKENDNDG